MVESLRPVLLMVLMLMRMLVLVLMVLLVMLLVVQLLLAMGFARQIWLSSEQVFPLMYALLQAMRATQIPILFSIMYDLLRALWRPEETERFRGLLDFLHGVTILWPYQRALEKI